jgi:NTP pyrophosphatase (non-canonical NTP hydrolase)
MSWDAERARESQIQAMKNLSIKNSVDIVVDHCYSESESKGWWKAKDGSDVRDNPLTFSNKLCLIHSEISEAMEGDRKNAMDDKLPHRKAAEVELADALIRICDLAGGYGFDLGGAVVEKMEYNRTRKDHYQEAREADNGKRY